MVLSGNTFYGTAQDGGDLGEGTVFGLSLSPQLTITPSGANVLLTWPATLNYSSYTLQSTTDLVPPVAWATNSLPPIVTSGHLTVTNPTSGTQEFYRLIH